MQRRPALAACAALGFLPHGWGARDAIAHWAAQFQPSSLSAQAQREELAWFRAAAAPFRGQSIKVVSEIIDTHEYEAKVLAPAFSEITGIQVQHELIPEGEVVRRIREQMLRGTPHYDAYVNDSDLIGTHWRYDATLVLSDWMRGEGRAQTLPTLDLKDFIGLAFTTAPNGDLYQLPDQQFANLYWFRHDWFSRPDLQRRFQTRYGYALGVPLNWSAYEDIAEFFSHEVQRLDGRRIYGHMDYGKRDPSLGWRFTDAWLSMAGQGSPGYPNGLPVDEWGLRMEGCRPVGASVARGGGTNSPAARYALERYLDWLRRFAPPGAAELDFNQAGPVPGQGAIAQQIFWYTAFTAAMSKPGLPVNHADGRPKWRVAPSPHGAYWQSGMQRGYQDVGAWTLLKSTPLARRRMAWLYAQFCVCKAVSLKKSLTGLTFVRESDIRSEAMTRLAPRLGGLVEFYRSPSRVYWTPTGPNVPDYPELAELWWQHVGMASEGRVGAQQALDDLAEAMDASLARLARSQNGPCAPRLRERLSEAQWQTLPGAARPRLANEKPPGRTIAYERLLRMWQFGSDAK
ncbi:ABC transporter substrate-binding protein [Inhella proteolytica]|uniref:Carbohydrate ABC transporter substrate-binding protein n=1 Tax=Inhella proteolytica TaxID=2795029 RepID=A0A931NIM1_9BURK|nr:ABC transporter substrate-binding protein [Inhella proteolytica]MBH9578179.1 carbohydrate ABC transporter substrate-binding protein [Inhella proteolytica]